MFGVKGDVVTGAEGPPIACEVSNRVIANPLGTLPDPLAFRFFALGPPEAEGEA